MSRAPAHAGRLRPSEQFVFALVFALMAGFVVVITMSAARSAQDGLFAGGTTAEGTQTVPAGTGEGTVKQKASSRLDASLAAALAPVLRAHPGQLAVGVIDETAGQRAFYHATQQFSSAGVITADILAALLIRHQQAGTMLTSVQSGLVTAMMDTADHVNGAGSRSDAAAVSLWRAIGGGQGLAADNRLLKLSHTIPGSGDRWDQTQTTAADQLQLLTDLTSARSPLTGSARDYALRLMTRPTPLRWGVAAAGQLATNSTGAARSEVADGSLRLGQDWVVASIGIVRHAGHVLLVAVLSSRTLSRAAGISLVSAAAVAAADVVS